MQLTPGLRRVGNEIVASYLFIDRRGVTIVDAGLPGHYRDLIVELADAGLTIDDVRAVILTHGDSDHLGFAERLRRDHGVPVHVHSADADRAKGGDKPETPFGRGIRPWPVVRFFAYALGKGGAKTEYLTDARTLEGGERLADLPGSPEIVPMPGHSPGSIAVLSRELDAIAVGDALTTRHVLSGRRGPQPAPFTDDPGVAIESLDRLAATDATWVLPGHGTPWNRGTSEAVRLVREVAAASTR